MGKNKTEFLSTKVCHLDVKAFDFESLMDGMQYKASQARKLASAAKIFDQKVTDKKCGIVLCLARSLVSAELKKVTLDVTVKDLGVHAKLVNMASLIRKATA